MNQTLLPKTPSENRVVFFGDSITEFWDLSTTFPEKPYLNRGIAGQTTAQMLLRFRADVISLHPTVVVILAGTNDLAGITGPMTLERITDNYASLAELAHSHGIRVIFASVLPIHDDSPVRQSELRPPAKIQALNDWLQKYCLEAQHFYLDYYPHLIDTKGRLNPDLSDDGLHLNAMGYAVIAPLAEKLIQQALGN